MIFGHLCVYICREKMLSMANHNLPASNSHVEKKLCQWKDNKRLSGHKSFDQSLLDPTNLNSELYQTVNLLRGRLAARHGDFLFPIKSTEELKLEKPVQKVTLENFEPDWSKFETAYAKELLPANDGYQRTVGFLTEVVDMLLDYLHKMNDRSKKVLDFHHPHQMKEALNHCLDIPESPRDLEQILSDCKETLKFSVKTGHPRFFNQLSSGLDVIAMAGEWLTAATNTNMFTYEIAPVFVLMEEVTLQKMREHIGWEKGDGILAPGGSISNLYAVMLARYYKCPEIKTKGMVAMPNLVMFTSEHSHYSIKKAAAVMGIGTDNVVLIKTDDRGHMIVADLEAKIILAREKGQEPFFVSGTGGTTVLGSFDPIHEIADVCEKHGLWFHVDCAWGGGILLSQQHRYRLDGVSRADSVTWNPHKLMGITLQCSMVLLPEKHIGLLTRCNEMKAKYLFQKDKQYDIAYDTGDKSIQCGRRNDIFKLWLSWRSKGDEGYGETVDYLFNLAQYLCKQLELREGFKFVLEKPEFVNVCFWYIPKRYRQMPPGVERNAAIHQVAPQIKAMMMESGGTMVGYQPLGALPNFFRMIISNPASTEEDIDFMLDTIEEFGEQI